MFPFWKCVTEPLLHAIKPKGIVEVGSEQGKSTDLLLDFCVKFDSVLHVIEPAPRYDPKVYADKFGERFVMYRDLSLNALPKIQADYDVALLDGDHNWYTVFNELRIIEEQCKHRGRPFPLVLLHDVAWPYGRRDLYYDPSTIPEEFRRPFARKGLIPGQSALAESGGMNSWLYHAIEENTPRNGVRTGIEDFLKQSEFDLDFLFVPGFFGLGIVVRKELRRQGAPVAVVLSQWDFSPAVAYYLQLMETVRVQLVLQQTLRK